jgi:hypothetical protein
VGVAGGVSAVTDEQGRFMLRGVRAGTVMLEAGQLGYKDLKESREVVADGSPLRIEMEPDPIELKGIQVTSDRLRQRRNALAVSVRAYDATELATTPAFDALDFLRGRVMVGSCPRSSWSSTCVLRRGQWISPAVYVDDAPWGGGLDILIGWNPSDLYLIEVLASGSQIRLYTKGFAQRLALGRAPLQPVILW